MHYETWDIHIHIKSTYADKKQTNKQTINAAVICKMKVAAK